MVVEDYSKYNVFIGGEFGKTDISDGAVSFKDGDEDNTLFDVGQVTVSQKKCSHQ